MSQGETGLGLIKARMQWLAARQTRLSDNIANASTPGFRPSDLKRFDPRDASGVGMAQTSASHLSGGTGAGARGTMPAARFETRPSGNSVNLEDEMLKISQTQIEHQTLAGLYQRSLGYLKTAIGRKG